VTPDARTLLKPLLATTWVARVLVEDLKDNPEALARAAAMPTTKATRAVTTAKGAPPASTAARARAAEKVLEKGKDERVQPLGVGMPDP